MKKILAYSVVFIFLACSCKKPVNPPEPEITEAHFYATCHVDGEPLNIKAGDEDYYMNSSWYHQDSNDIYIYKGNLAKQNGAGYQLTILINDYKKTSENALMQMDSALLLGRRLYDDKNEAGLIQNISFAPVKGYDKLDTYKWTITDGVISQPPLDDYIISDYFRVGKTYSVTLDYSNASGTCAQTHTNVFKAGSKVQTTVKGERDPTKPGLAYKFSYSSPSGADWKCLWTFPDATQESTRTVSKIFNTGTHIVKLKITDQKSGDSCISYYQLHANDFEGCEANFAAQFSYINNTRLFSSVTVLLTDLNGSVYSSGNLVQPITSDFEILEVSDYQLNTDNQPTKRLKIKFNCIVKNGAKEINLTNGEARIAVAYK